jgi:tRNA pseudouridine55 synthase
MTSHDVVAYIRRLTGQRKAGHAGTLDPMATGVLLLCLGKATRVSEYLMAGRKQYRALVRLGVTTDTYDADGTITHSREVPPLSRNQIAQTLVGFQGPIQQVPPSFSAIKHKGQRMYEVARRGITVQISPRIVEIDAIELVSWESPDLTLEVLCSPGTYIRSLAHDLGQVLGVGGHLAALTRLASGNWRIEDAVTLDELQRAVKRGDWIGHLHPLDAALLGFERVDLTADMAHRVSQGQSISLDPQPQTAMARAYAPDDNLVALLRPSRKAGFWRPKKVFINLAT